MKVPLLCTISVRHLATASLAALACLAVSGRANAQVAGDGVRVIDIKFIFENHTRFKAARVALSKEYDAAATRVKDEATAIKQLEKKLIEWAPSSPEYKQHDEQLAHRRANLKIESDKQLKDFQLRQSEILWNVYYEVQQAVEEFSKKNNVGLVIQFNGDQIDSRKPGMVTQAINRPIVWVASNRDITPHVLDRIDPPWREEFERERQRRAGGQPAVPAAAPGQQFPPGVISRP